MQKKIFCYGMFKTANQNRQYPNTLYLFSFDHKLLHLRFVVANILVIISLNARLDCVLECN